MSHAPSGTPSLLPPDPVGRPVPRAFFLDWLRIAAFVLLVLLGMALIRLTLYSRFGSTHALVDDWFNHASYGLLFLLGVGLALYSQHFVRLQALRCPALVLALLCWAGIEACLGHVARMGVVPEGLRALQRVAYAALQWCAIVVAAVVLAPRALPVAVEAPLLLVLAFAGSAAFWWLARSTGPLRPWLGLPRRLTCRSGSCLRRP